MSDEEIEAVLQLIKNGISNEALYLTHVTADSSMIGSSGHRIGFNYAHLGMYFKCEVSFDGDWRNVEKILKHFKKRVTDEKPENADFVEELKKI